MSTNADNHSPNSRERWYPWILAALALLLLLPGNNVLPLIDRDEPRFAQATREMMGSGAWIVPTFNGEERLHKPILTYWMMRASYAVFGVNEFGARFHSVVCAAALALVVYAMGRRWFSAKAGFAAAFGLLTCLQMLVHGRSAVADLPMILFVTTSQWALFELLVGTAGPSRPQENGGAVSHRALPFWTLYLSLGLGFLAKGPVAWIVPGLTLVLYRGVFLRQPLPWSRLKVHLGLPVVLAIIGVWGIPALIETQGRFWSVGIGEHVVDRGLKVFNKRSFTPLYYVFTSLLSLYPWSCYAPRALARGWKARTPQTSFLLAWFAAPFVVFSFYATQLPHYVMPGYPALFLLFGTFVGQTPARWERIWKSLVLAIGVVLAAALIAAWLKFAALRVVLGGLCLLVTGLTLAATRFKAVAVLALVVAAPLLGSGLRASLPALLLKDTFDAMPADAKFACWAYREPSLMFYSNRRWEELKELDAAKAFLAEPGPRLLLVPEAYRDLGDVLKGQKGPSKTLEAELKDLSGPGANSTTVDGFNVARSQFVKLRVFYKRD